MTNQSDKQFNVDGQSNPLEQNMNTSNVTAAGSNGQSPEKNDQTSRINMSYDMLIEQSFAESNDEQKHNPDDEPVENIAEKVAPDAEHTQEKMTIVDEPDFVNEIPIMIESNPNGAESNDEQKHNPDNEPVENIVEKVTPDTKHTQEKMTIVDEPDFVNEIPIMIESNTNGMEPVSHLQNQVEVVSNEGSQTNESALPSVVQINGITKTYEMGDFELQVLKGISLTIREGEFISIMGPSGSGKSTLMNILGLLDEPTDGEYYLDDKDVSKLKESERAVLRNQKIGFVFQSFNLLKRTPAINQVALPLIYGSQSKRSQLAKEALEAVGLGQRLDHTPAELSGGQQQRVAIARALVTEPSLILADEPTGNLDSKSGIEVMQIFQRLNREEKKTTVFVTHDSWIARHTDRVIMLRDGKIIADQKIDNPLIAGESERPSAAGDLQGIFDETYYGGDESEYN